MSFTIGSLFDGSGGFPLAAFLVGGVPVWASEIEPYPIAVTKSRFPYMKHLGSVTDINGAEVDPVDVISFGSPCQDLSVAGKRAGLKHEANGDEETTRSGLFMEAVRIIKEMREKTNGVYPRIAVWENVPGAFSSNKGEDFRVVCEELIKIVEPTASMPPVPKNGWAYADCYCGDGWSLAYRVLDAQHWGVPQRRRRIYLVADFGGPRAGKILFERDGVRGYFTEGRTPWQTTPADVKRGVGADDREGDSLTLCMATQQGGAEIMEDKCPTITAAAGMSGNNQPVACYVDTNNEQYLFENHSQDSRYKGPLDVCPMLSAQLGTGGNNQPLVMEPFCKSKRAQTKDDVTTWKHAKVANTINTFDMGEARANELVVESVAIPNGVCYSTSHGSFHINAEENIASTLMGTDYKDPPTVAYWDGGQLAGTLTENNAIIEHQPIAIDRAFYNQGVNALYDPQLYEDGTCPTLVARGPAAVCHRYVVRRLTPTECARLQGFPDKWGHPDHKDSLTDEEYRFWLDVRNTHATINGKATKDYTASQMLTWYNKLHADSSEYKMWGNGIALPNALYVMQGIAEVFK